MKSLEPVTEREPLAELKQRQRKEQDEPGEHANAVALFHPRLYKTGMDDGGACERYTELSDAAERDHRISNSLSIISGLVHLKAKQAEVGDVRRTLLDVAGRIDMVARLHRLLAHASTPAIPIGDYLHEVCRAMTTIAENEDRLQVTVDCPDGLRVPPDTALRLGLLTAELFSNAVKYAHPTGVPTTIKVGCRRAGADALVFAFEDDGIGFPEGFDPMRVDGLGMRILRSVSAQLQGDPAWRDLGVGLRFECRFPAGSPSN
jgi:two-component sensor histidine kinase